MLAHAATALYLVVRLYDMHGVPSDTLAVARAATERILADADITVRWAACPCANPAGPAELTIRVSDVSPDSDAASLGFSYVDVDRRAGTLATVFPERIHALAQVARADDGELLGRAVAHEIGHLLFGTRDHGVAGLMRGKWTSLEVAANRRSDWQFSRSDGARLRQALVRRNHLAGTPAALVAGLQRPASSTDTP